MGELFLVGMGPGDLPGLTQRAREALEGAEVVIGYSTYVKLLEEMGLLAGKEVVRKGMTEELDRAEEALERALSGQRVALVSGGDPGIYGMAAPVLELMEERGLKRVDGGVGLPGRFAGEEGEVFLAVIPGVTAANAVASLLGSPLAHDTCLISLSDLLTPWPLIERRLHAAGQGDFVVVLYNPQSKRRDWQLRESAEILLEYRPKETPAALVKSAYRKRQEVALTTLEGLREAEAGMLTTVVIGNRQSRFYEGTFLTPRGYALKYDLDTKEALPGETPGLSLRRRDA
ncbi:precorrin-3B C(17)-methyltransferase (plasmid) [Thermus thermophilus]|uniref:precorrin-3B C(17)-methyltransferase n=1 Tax=Thermus TaxID=270 RepID=UPI000F805651|nr:MULTISPECIES: precorrin-3B C(17)-methyltransferase [Thermus]RTI39965.1 precorrin-3B C(17)-methyltransferase [Thermus scotoductus]BCZ90438.1 precorrin-3B C(17)-methyltransferase [Thermus thermophilus]BCZ93191.1 precorrin-3B C(17)-methyltransferase [Thermus thermophilus]BCZ95491.1 precorrin-3B C(17)-methyltransferase [Thermus thermophilus]